MKTSSLAASATGQDKARHHLFAGSDAPSVLLDVLNGRSAELGAKMLDCVADNADAVITLQQPARDELDANLRDYSIQNDLNRLRLTVPLGAQCGQHIIRIRV